MSSGIAEVRNRDLQQACMLSSISVLAIAVIMMPPPCLWPGWAERPGHGVSMPYPVIRAARMAVSDLLTLLPLIASSSAFTAAS